LAVGVLFLVPFIWLVVTAFTKNGTLAVSFSGGLTTGNFSGLFAANSASEAIGEGVGGALLNSLYLSGGTMVITTVIAVLTAYPLSRFNIPGRNVLVYAIVFVTGLPIIAVIIPTYDIFVSLNFVNSLWWTVLFLTATSLPFAVWIGGISPPRFAYRACWSSPSTPSSSRGPTSSCPSSCCKRPSCLLR
jgi:multiple sugar transport system permease protein